jgi:hypothetical protein
MQWVNKHTEDRNFTGVQVRLPNNLHLRKGRCVVLQVCVRVSPTPRAPARQRELATEPSRVSPARLSQLHGRVRDKSVDRSDQQRRYVNYGERNLTSDRCGSPRLGEGQIRSPSPADIGDSGEYSFSIFQVCITLTLLVFFY